MSAGISERSAKPESQAPVAISTPQGASKPLVAVASRSDTIYLPSALFLAFFILYALTATGFHTFDGIAYIRDMGKPLAAMVLPHHLIYEPAVFGLYNLWRALGWTGHADLPAQLLSSLAGAGGVAVFYKLAWELSKTRIVALIFALLLAFSYGYWFYSVEVEIYVPPLFFLLTALWLLQRAVVRNDPSPSRLMLIGLCHALAALIHQAALFIVPAFALGLWLIPATLAERLRRILLYGVALAFVVGPSYLFAGVVIAGQSTPEAFMRWVNNYGSLGTWGAWRTDSADATVSGLSAAVSSEFLTGRLLVLMLVALVLLRAAPITRRGGPLAWTLWAWFAIYGLFFAWWQPENLKFWVFMLPAPLTLAVIAFDWQTLNISWRRVALSVGLAAAGLLLLTNAPTIWARRDPMSDPARRVSDALARLSEPEDLILLQAGNAEHHLPFYYDRINLVSTRELWYSSGGAGGRQEAVAAIRERMWHTLAKGGNVWLEDRVLATGPQTSDHYVFASEQVDEILAPYGERTEPEKIELGSQAVYRLSPENAFSRQTEWHFEHDEGGWSGVNITGARTGDEGWCFSPLSDPALYGPPMRVEAANLTAAVIKIKSRAPGTAQLFYKSGPREPYAEERSLAFAVEPGERYYTLDLARAAGWEGTIWGLRLDPVQGPAVTEGVEDSVCIGDITVQAPLRLLTDQTVDSR